AKQCSQVRSPRLIDWGWHCYDEEVSGREFVGVRGEHHIRAGKIIRLDLAGSIASGLQFGNACGVDIEADHRRTLSPERDGDRQPDISETDDGELATVRHDLP